MKNKKSIIAIVAVCVLGIIGTTIAYYTANKTFENIFRTTSYSMNVTEEFESPEDWTPGTTTDKNVVANNTGTVDAAVRVSYEEEWTDAEGNPLPLEDSQNPSQRYAIINQPIGFDEMWIESTENGKVYYYYKYKVAPGHSSASFMDSVTFNPNALIETNEECELENICTLSLDGHAGGQYKLTVTVETAQFDKYKEIWETEIDIADDMPSSYTILSGDLNTVGSVVKIANEEFYIIGQEDTNHIKLLSKWNLNVGHNIQPGTVGLQNSLSIGWNRDSSTKVNGWFPSTVYFTTNGPYWWTSNEDMTLKPEYGGYGVNSNQYSDGNGNLVYPYIYTAAKENGEYVAIIASYVEDYVTYLKNYGVNVTGRLLTYNEMTELGCAESYECTGESWVYNTTFYTGSLRSTNLLWLISSTGQFGDNGYGISNGYIGVRPVIVLEK